MRCKACNSNIEREVWDKETQDYSDLCPPCYLVSELVRHNEFTDYREYGQDIDSSYNKINYS